MEEERLRIKNLSLKQ